MHHRRGASAMAWTCPAALRARSMHWRLCQRAVLILAAARWIQKTPSKGWNTPPAAGFETFCDGLKVFNYYLFSYLIYFVCRILHVVFLRLVFITLISLLIYIYTTTCRMCSMTLQRSHCSTGRTKSSSWRSMGAARSIQGCSSISPGCVIQSLHFSTSVHCIA